MLWDGDEMNNRMEWSWFRVLMKETRLTQARGGDGPSNFQTVVAALAAHQSPCPLKYQLQNVYRPLRWRPQHVCNKWLWSINPSFLHGCVKLPTHFFPFLCFPLLALLYSCSCVAPRRLGRFKRFMAQETWIGARKCLLYVCIISYHY